MKYNPETNQFIQEYDDTKEYYVYLLEDYFFATKGDFILKVVYANKKINPLEFMSILK